LPKETTAAESPNWASNLEPYNYQADTLLSPVQIIEVLLYYAIVQVHLITSVLPYKTGMNTFDFNVSRDLSYFVRRRRPDFESVVGLSNHA